MIISKLKHNKIISAASDTTIGSKLYEITLPEIEDAYKDKNRFIYEYIKDEGWDAINFKSIFGSDVIDDKLYLLVTDGKLIRSELGDIDPSTMLQEFSIEELDFLIERNVTPDFIRTKLSLYEFHLKDMDNDRTNQYAIAGLEDGVNFEDLIDQYDAISFIIN